MAFNATLLKQSKKLLRKEIHGKLSNLSSIDIDNESEKITSKLLALRVIQDAKGVALYMSMKNEFQTMKLIENLFDSVPEKTLYLPRVIGPSALDMVMLKVTKADFLEKKLQVSKYGILEPTTHVDVNQDRPTWQMKGVAPIEVVIVPGVAFEVASGARLGHGKGYYDTFLSNLIQFNLEHGLPKPVLIGVCLSSQLVSAGTIPLEPHDLNMDMIVSI
jgi:5-formyltetrahydrofolate cyclo-ligase